MYIIGVQNFIGFLEKISTKYTKISMMGYF